MFSREMLFYNQNRNGKAAVYLEQPLGCSLPLLSFSRDVETSFLQLVKQFLWV